MKLALRPRSLALLVLLAAYSVGCGRSLLVIMPTAPTGAVLNEARVSVNGQFVGSGSVEVARQRAMVVHVDATPQYEPAQVSVESRTQSPLVISLREDELFASTVADENQLVNTWLQLNVGPQSAMSGSWWSTVVNAIATQDFEPEMMDANSGFLRTAWKQRTNNNGVSVRRRFVGNVVQTSPLQWRVRYEVQMMRQGDQNWTDYSRGFREELDALGEVRARIAQ